jgi:hypothetical protein
MLWRWSKSAGAVKERGGAHEQPLAIWSEAVVIAGLTLCWSGAAAAPSGGASRAAAGAAADTALNKNIGKHKSPTSLDDSLDLVRQADLPEESAFKAFQFVWPGNMTKKIELGEAFLQKYQVSRNRAECIL